MFQIENNVSGHKMLLFEFQRFKKFRKTSTHTPFPKNPFFTVVFFIYHSSVRLSAIVSDHGGLSWLDEN